MERSHPHIPCEVSPLSSFIFRFIFFTFKTVPYTFAAILSNLIPLKLLLSSFSSFIHMSLDTSPSVLTTNLQHLPCRCRSPIFQAFLVVPVNPGGISKFLLLNCLLYPSPPCQSMLHYVHTGCFCSATHSFVSYSVMTSIPPYVYPEDLLSSLYVLCRTNYKHGTLLHLFFM